MRHVRSRCLAVTLLLLGAAWPRLALATMLPPQCSGPATATTASGFVEVIGPSAAEPEHAGMFPRQPGPNCPPAQPAPPPPAHAAAPPDKH